MRLLFLVLVFCAAAMVATAADDDAATLSGVGINIQIAPVTPPCRNWLDADEMRLHLRRLVELYVDVDEHPGLGALIYRHSSSSGVRDACDLIHLGANYDDADGSVTRAMVADTDLGSRCTVEAGGQHVVVDCLPL